jgi:hypothetical protein
MAKYLILIYENESSYASATPEVWQQVMEAHNRFAAQVGELGAEILGGEALSRSPPPPRSGATWSPTGRSRRPRRRSAAST